MTAKTETAGDLDLDSFDLQAEAEAGASMAILHPKTGKATGATLDLYGSDARAYRVALRRLRDTAAASFEREPTDEDDALLLGRARTAAAAVKGGSALKLKGEPVEYTPEGMVPIFIAYPWLTDQALRFINDRGNFGKA